jgi:hypothetical protein
MASLRSHVVIFSAALLLVAGCRAKTTSSSSTPTTDDGSLGTTEDALTADNDQSQEAEDDAEDGIENGLSGASPSDPGTPADASDTTGLDVKIKTNPGLYFKPAGCIVSTRLSPGVWNHVFTNCTGPNGKVTYNGTVKSTWTVSASTLEVKHEATNFTVTGKKVTATFSGSRDVTYTRQGTLITKHRVGDWNGTIASVADPSKSAPWTHHADFTSTWDSASKCYTRDGSAENSIGGREFGRKVSGFKVCGGIFACPQSGELELDRKDGTVTITVTFLGGTKVEITGPKGNSVTRTLLCDPN